MKQASQILSYFQVVLTSLFSFISNVKQSNDHLHQRMQIISEEVKSIKDLRKKTPRCDHGKIQKKLVFL